MSNDKAIQKTDEAVPKYLQVKDNQTGAENISANDIVVPRIKICQALSEIKKENKDVTDGMIYSNMGEVFGEVLKFFPLLFWRSTVWFSEDKKLLCTVFTDPESREPVVFGNDPDLVKASDKELAEKKVTMSDSHNYMIIPEKTLAQALKKGEIPFPTIYSGMSAAIKYCRQLNGKIKTNSLKKIPIYGQLVAMKTQADTFKKGEAYMPRFGYGRFASEDEFKFLQELQKSCRQLLTRSEAHTYDEESTEPEVEQKKEKNASDETDKLFDD